MTIGPQELQAIESATRLAGQLLPDLVKWIAELIAAGHSEEEALEIVNIQSRRAEYEKAKAEDRARLDAKHRTPGNPFDPDFEDP